MSLHNFELLKHFLLPYVETITLSSCIVAVWLYLIKWLFLAMFIQRIVLIACYMYSCLVYDFVK